MKQEKCDDYYFGTASSNLEFDRYKVKEPTQGAASSQLLYEVQQKKHLDEPPGKMKGNGESSISQPEQCNLLSGKELRIYISIVLSNYIIINGD